MRDIARFLTRSFALAGVQSSLVKARLRARWRLLAASALIALSGLTALAAQLMHQSPDDNRHERAADATVPSAIPVIGIELNGSGAVITFQATQSLTYRLERKLNLTDSTWQILSNVADVTAASSSPTMMSDPNAISLDQAFYRVRIPPIYVSVNDTAAIDDGGCGLGPVGSGTGRYPCKSIAQGIARATALSRNEVDVADGTYNEAVILTNGASVLGGFDPNNWSRHVSSTNTIVQGVLSVGNHDRTVAAISITAATTFEGFVVHGSNNSKTSGNSYAIYVADSNANLQILNNVIYGGMGGPGQSGSNGSDGANGPAGAGRNSNMSIADPNYDATAATGSGECNISSNRQITNGGVNVCNGDDVSGGNGGGNRCAVMSYCDTWDPNFGCLQNSTNFHWNKFTAIDGVAGQVGAVPLGGTGGSSGIGGEDMIQIWANFSGGYFCYYPSDATFGTNGGDGGNGTSGNAVGGCSASAGSVSGGDWLGGTANNGINGGNGGGAGGGGAGGGDKCENDGHGHTACADGTGKDSLGAHGGGGGAGGCGGTSGGAATPGGGSFGIFIVGTSAPLISGNQIFCGQGGSGGTGGSGGKAGSGGNGGLGGSPGVLFCSDAGGNGGKGGNGGPGSGGGGGCGGSTFGIYTSGIGTPNYCTSVGNVISGGSVGGGGAGGGSLGNTGGAGQNGIVFACSFN